ncbi:MAG: magnesium transporter [Alphaproteobacteria bacterium]|nr:magnesium transporter [Alphaproteobacteria bacterium]
MKKKSIKHTPLSKRKLAKHFSKKNKKEEVQSYLGLGPKFVNSIIIGLNENDDIHVKKIIADLDEYDLAKLIEVLDIGHRRKLVNLIGDKIDPAVIPELNEVVQEQVLESLDENQIVKIVNELDSDDAVEVLENLDDDEQEQIIQHLDPELKYQVQSSLNYPEESAGRIMSRDFVSMPDNWSVKEAKQYLLTNDELPDEFYTVFLVDEKTLRPTGEITLDKLLRAKANEKLSTIMDGEIVPLDVHTDQEEVAHMFREYGWMSAMVVDAKGRLIGVINIDDVIEIIHEEANEDIMGIAGAESGDVYRSVFDIFKSRSVWLVTNLFATIVAASVVGGFQDIIAELSILAVLMPIVASMGGTTGQQTLAVVVRSLATKELNSRNALRMIGKEFMVGLCNGILFAIMIGIAVYIWVPEQIMISYIIALAMLCNLTVASLAGILIPLTLNKLKVDPAISSGVFLIACTDSGGYFIFLGLAKLLLF